MLNISSCPYWPSISCFRRNTYSNPSSFLNGLFWLSCSSHSCILSTSSLPDILIYDLQIFSSSLNLLFSESNSPANNPFDTQENISLIFEKNILLSDDRTESIAWTGPKWRENNCADCRTEQTGKEMLGVLWVKIFLDEVLPHCPGWPQTPGLKQSSCLCLSLLDSWDHMCITCLYRFVKWKISFFFLYFVLNPSLSFFLK
jgi:hypothetical protein